jgi:hypothetical protein
MNHSEREAYYYDWLGDFDWLDDHIGLAAAANPDPGPVLAA